MDKSYRDLFDDSEIAVAKHLVTEFRETRPCLQREGFDDLLQECLIHWLSIRDGYDPKHGASQSTFMGRVVRNKLTDLVRERETDKRRLAYTAVSLHEPSGTDEGSPTLEDTVVDARPAASSRIGLRMDLAALLPKLDRRQRKLCHLLGHGGLKIKQASEYLNTPRSTIYDELERIRKIFLKEGLGEYLK
jgi:RNA polymerase sigma-70 factor (ECF subfamily)